MAKIIPFNFRKSDSEGFPEVFRIRSLSRAKDEDGSIQHKATIFHNSFEYRVSWKSQASDDLKPGDLVKIEWGEWPVCNDGSLALAGLTRVLID